MKERYRVKLEQIRRLEAERAEAIERGDPVPRRVQFNLDMARIEAEELRTWGNRELTRQIRERHEPQHFSGSRCKYPGPGVGFC